MANITQYSDKRGLHVGWKDSKGNYSLSDNMPEMGFLDVVQWSVILDIDWELIILKITKNPGGDLPSNTEYRKQLLETFINQVKKEKRG